MRARFTLVTCVLLVPVTALVLGVATARGKSENALSFRIADETAPAGSLVQMKIATTEATPISGGRPRFSFALAVSDRVAGVGMFARGGELAGAAYTDANHLVISYVTTTPMTGNDPVLAVSLPLRPDLAAGTRATVSLDASSLWTVNGGLFTTKMRTANVTVGGTLAITDVVPGEGWFPAGTVVSVRGMGFSSDTRLGVQDVDIADVQLVSSTEMRFTLAEAVNLAGAQIRVDDPAGSIVIYYSYLRGIPDATSARPLLSRTEPIFSAVTRSVATIGPMPLINDAFQYVALALQNPGLESADLAVELRAGDGALLESAYRPLESGHRLALTASELLGGVPIPPGSSVRVTASRPIEAFGLTYDERIRSITPRLPLEPAN